MPFGTPARGYRVEYHNLDGQGDRPHRVYSLPPFDGEPSYYGRYWDAVTDVPCPSPNCDGIVRWAENSHVPGYRICDGCGRHFLADGDDEQPTLILMGYRRGWPPHVRYK